MIMPGRNHIVRVRKGAVWDTNKSRKIADFSIGESLWKAEGALYQRPQGSFFVAGKGGPLSMFGKPDSKADTGAMVAAEWAIPLTKEQAKEFLINACHSPQQVIDILFPAVE